MQVYNFACGCIWVWNLVSDIKGGTQTEGVWEQGTEENIWTEKRSSDRTFFFLICFMRLLALRPQLTYCASLGW
jgi:hypothetical protein